MYHGATPTVSTCNLLIMQSFENETVEDESDTKIDFSRDIMAVIVQNNQRDNAISIDIGNIQRSIKDDNIQKNDEWLCEQV